MRGLCHCCGPVFGRLGFARHEISNRFAAAPIQQREYGALRIRAMDDPSAARHFDRAIEDFAAAGLHALRRRLDVARR